MGRGNALRSSQIYIITAKVKKLWRQIHNWTALIWWSFCRWWQHNFRPLDLQAFHRLFSVGLPTGLIIMPYWLQTCTIWIQLKCCLNTALLSQQERAVAPLLFLRFFLLRETVLTKYVNFLTSKSQTSKHSFPRRSRPSAFVTWRLHTWRSQVPKTRNLACIRRKRQEWNDEMAWHGALWK